MIIEMFDSVEILRGHREGDSGTVISIEGHGFDTTYQVQLSKGEIHDYDKDDLYPIEDGGRY